MPNANQKAKAGIIATRKLLAKERMAGFKATSSALDAIYGNLSTTQAGIGRSQTVANQKTMAALARLAGKTDRATGRIVRGGEAQASNAYGSVIGAAVDRQSGVTEAHATAARAAVGAEVKAGLVGVKGAANVLAITKAGAREAAAGASGQLADALQYRAKQDAQIVAGMQQARMEAQLQFQNWKRQQDYLAKQEAKDTKGALGGVVQATDTASTAAAYMRNWLAENAGSTAPEALAAYNAEYGTLDAAQPLLTLISQSVYGSVDKETGLTKTGYDRTDETRDIVQALHTLYPNFGPQREAIRRTIAASLAAGYADDAAKAAEHAVNPDFSKPANQLIDPNTEHGGAFGQNADSVQAGIETGATVTTQTGDPAQEAATNATAAMKKVQSYSRAYWADHKDTPENRARLENDPVYQRLLAQYQEFLQASNPF